MITYSSNSTSAIRDECTSWFTMFLMRLRMSHWESIKQAGSIFLTSNPSFPHFANFSVRSHIHPVWICDMLSLSSLCTYLGLLQDDVLMAYQICYDLFENEMQAFMLKVTAPWALLFSQDQHQEAMFFNLNWELSTYRLTCCISFIIRPLSVHHSISNMCFLLSHALNSRHKASTYATVHG